MDAIYPQVDGDIGTVSAGASARDAGVTAT